MMAESKAEQSERERTLFVHGDPLGVLLLERLHLSPLKATIVTVLLLFSPVFVLVAINDLWLSQGETLGILADYAYWWSILVANPVNIFFFLSLPRWLSGVIGGLSKNGVIGEPIARNGIVKDLEGFLIDFDRAYTRPIWAMVAAGVSMVAVNWIIVPSLGETETYANIDMLASTYDRLWQVVVWYVVFLLAIRAAIAIRWFWFLFRRFNITVRGLHPDRVGGFSPFGQLVTRAGYLIGMYGTTLLVYWFDLLRRAPDTADPVLVLVAPIFFLFLFILLAPTVFFALVGSAHWAMKRFKNDLELQMARQLNFDALLIQAAGTARRHELRRDAVTLERIQTVHKMIADLPEWPLDTRGIVRFYVVVLLPVAAGIVIPILVNVVSALVLEILGRG
jgi:hypothetical protein